MALSEIKSKPSISTLELLMLAYGALCTFLVAYAMSRNTLFSLCMIPAGVGGVCIAIMFNNHLQKHMRISHISPRMKLVGASVMPLLFLVLASYQLWVGNLNLAGANAMMFGASILIAVSHLGFHRFLQKDA